MSRGTEPRPTQPPDVPEDPGAPQPDEDEGTRGPQKQK